MSDHPLQPIRDSIDKVYLKALADDNEPARMVTLTMLVHLNTLNRDAGLPPIQRSST